MARFLIIQREAYEVPPEVAKEAIPAQFAYFKQLQAQGKIEAIAGFATARGGYAIVNVDSHEELQRIANLNPPVAVPDLGSSPPGLVRGHGKDGSGDAEQAALVLSSTWPRDWPQGPAPPFPNCDREIRI